MKLDLKRLTLDALRRGIFNSDAMREWLAANAGQTIDSCFTNAHAWALVHLQKDGLIEKVAEKTYRLIEASQTEHKVPEPTDDFMPRWAKVHISKANNKNGPECPRFTNDDLLHLWNECGGRCAVTGLPFSLEKVGSGAAKKVFAPSLDRIQAGGCYSRENCRLVMVGVNFAINSWGLDTYLRLAEAAVRFQEQVKT